MRSKGYYEALGLTPYWFAHVIDNVVDEPRNYMRGLHDILGEDGRATNLCDPFPKWSNLHMFISAIFESIIHEPTEEGIGTFRMFLELIGAPKDWLEDIEDEGPGEIVFSELYDEGRDRVVEEIFHILFRDVVFLERFNSIVAYYISDFGSDTEGTDDRFTVKGNLRRVAVPRFVQDAIYFRDGGECRSCKKAIDRVLSPKARERYDHIIPLAQSGANDITNMQLLCESCNSTKGSKLTKVSSHFPRIYQL